MAELKFEIVKEFGVLSQSPSGWTKELNLVSWNDREPKYDIREWAPEHTKMGKGVTISADEIILRATFSTKSTCKPKRRKKGV